MDDRVAGYMRDRPAERVWLHHDETLRASFDKVAEVAGIQPLSRAWIEIDERQAEEILAKVLRTDLAYSTENMPEHRARWLAREFVGSCGSWGTRFATNTDGDPHTNGRSWTPATDFTFDCGVVALGPSGSRCYWIGSVTGLPVGDQPANTRATKLVGTVDFLTMYQPRCSAAQLFSVVGVVVA